MILQKSEAHCRLNIPNREIAFAYDDMVKAYFSHAGGQEYQVFINSLVNGDIASFQDRLQAYLNDSTSYFDINSRTPEQVYHMFVLGLVMGLRDQYHIKSNLESGLGRCDVMLRPKDLTKAGIILEFKSSRDG